MRIPLRSVSYVAEYNNQLRVTMGVFGETYCCDCESWFANGELSTPFGWYVVSFVLFPKGTRVVVGDIIVLLI